MKKPSPNPETLAAYEDIMVQEFRTLQSLVNLTLEERQLMINRDHSRLMQIVEQKESVLDQFNLMEDTRRSLSREISLESGFATQTNSLAELLPYLESQVAARLERLNEGVTILAAHLRDLNLGNVGIATNKLDRLENAQAYLLQAVPPDSTPVFPSIANLPGTD